MAGLGLCLEISPDLNVAMHFFPSSSFFSPPPPPFFPFSFLFFAVSGISFKADDRSTGFFSYRLSRIVSYFFFSRKSNMHVERFLRVSPPSFPLRLRSCWRIIVSARRSFSILPYGMYENLSGVALVSHDRSERSWQVIIIPF